VTDVLQEPIEVDDDDCKSIESHDEESVHDASVAGNETAAGASSQTSSVQGRPRQRVTTAHSPVELSILNEGQETASNTGGLQLNRERDFTSFLTEQTVVQRTVALEAHPSHRDRNPTVGQPRESLGIPRTQTMRSDRTKRSGYGGFPTPVQILQSLAQRFAPETTKKLERTYSQAPAETRQPPAALFTSFPLKVGRNSLFLDLTKEQKEELGGIEYRASKLLLKVVYSVSQAVLDIDADG